jgi:DNA-binding winged helix-turn-helix (wHTH) protein
MLINELAPYIFFVCENVCSARPECDESLRHTPVVRFGTFEVSLASNEIRKAGVKIRVQQQPMKLLEMLLERPGEVVTREELRNRIWADENFGDFAHAVNIAIAKLRNALGDSAASPRYIETLPKRGYRFIAEVSVVDTGTRAKTPESAAGDMHYKRGYCAM